MTNSLSNACKLWKSTIAMGCVEGVTDAGMIYKQYGALDTCVNRHAIGIQQPFRRNLNREFVYIRHNLLVHILNSDS